MEGWKGMLKASPGGFACQAEAFDSHSLGNGDPLKVYELRVTSGFGFQQLNPAVMWRAVRKVDGEVGTQ